MTKWKNSFSWNKTPMIPYASRPGGWLKTLPSTLLNFTQRRQGRAAYLSRIRHLGTSAALCLPECAVCYSCCHFCCSLEDATWGNGISECHQAFLVSPARAEGTELCSVVGRDVFGGSCAWHTGRKSLGKDGLDAMGRGCGWSRVKEGCFPADDLWLHSQGRDSSNNQSTWWNYPLQLLLKGQRLSSPSKHCFP